MSRGLYETLTRPVLRKSSPRLSRIANVSTVKPVRKFPVTLPMYTVPPFAARCTNGVARSRTQSRPRCVGVTNNTADTTRSPRNANTITATKATSFRRFILEGGTDRESLRETVPKDRRTMRRVRDRAGSGLNQLAVDYTERHRRRSRRGDTDERLTTTETGRADRRREVGRPRRVRVRVIPHVELNGTDRGEIGDSQSRRHAERLDVQIRGSRAPAP